MSSANLLTFGARYKVFAMALILIVCAVAGQGLLQLGVDASYASLMNQNDPDVPSYERVIKEFGSDNTTIVRISDRDLFSPLKLEKLGDLASEFEDMDGVERVDSLFSVTSIRDQEGSLDSKPLMDLSPETPEEAELIKRDALYSPLVSGNLISKDGRSTAINITVERQKDDKTYNARVYEDIEAILAPYREEFETVAQIGPPRLNVEIEQGMFEDLSVLTPISTAILVLCIIVLIRYWQAAVLPLFTSTLSILITFGVMGWIGLDLTLLTAIVPALIIVIGSTEDMHLVAAYMEGFEDYHKPTRMDLITGMSRRAGTAILLTGFTTAVGFLSNGVNDIPLIRDFAIASSIGMVANLFITITFVPLMLSIVGPRYHTLHNPDGDGHSMTGPIGVIVHVLELLVSRYGKLIAGVTIALVIAFGGLSTGVRVSNDPLSYFPDDHSIVKDAQILHDDLAGMQIFYITLRGEDGVWENPVYLKRLEAIVKFVEESGHYDKVLSYWHHIALVNQEMNGGDPYYYTTPDTEQLIQQFAILFQSSDLDRYISSDGDTANIIVRHNISDSEQLNALLKELATEIDRQLSADVEFTITGENLLINKAAESLLVGQVESLLLIGGIIFILMSLLYMSFYAGLMFLIPNLFPLVMNFGMMALLDIPLNPGSASVAAIALGIAVDDSIHLFARFRQEMRRLGDIDQAVLVTVRGEAIAVITTSLSLMAMYASLTISNFAIVAQFGLLAALTMIYALVADLLITPLILRRVGLVSLFEIVSLKINTQLLQESPLFRGFSKVQIKKTILMSKSVECEEGEHIIREGERERTMFILLSGKATAHAHTNTGYRQVGEFGPGDVFGEVAFMADQPRSATVTASSQVEALVLDPDKTFKALKFSPLISSKLNSNIGKILSERVGQRNEWAPGCAAAPVPTEGQPAPPKPTPQSEAQPQPALRSNTQSSAITEGVSDPTPTPAPTPAPAPAAEAASELEKVEPTQAEKRDVSSSSTPASTEASGAPQVVLEWDGMNRVLDQVGQTLQFGRSQDNDIILSGTMVSRRHGSLEFGAEGLVVTDKSANGTLVYLVSGEQIDLRKASRVCADSGELRVGGASGPVLRFAVSASAPA